MEAQAPNESSVENNQKELLSSLPFTYVRTDNPEESQYFRLRTLPGTWNGEKNEPFSDEIIIQTVREEHERKDWFTTEYWRNKGLPAEQIEFAINGRQITVYNFNQDKPYTDEHIQRASRVFQEFASKFPQIMDKLRWVLIDDQQKPSEFGDPEKYPTNGSAKANWKTLQLYPRGTELTPHRIPAAANFDGTLTHELTHLIESEFDSEWSEKFQWAYCDESPDGWELRLTPDGSMKRPFDKKTGEMSPQGQFSLQSGQCVTFYAKQNVCEDIAESMVAYIYDPEMLKNISKEKFEILQKHDAQKPIEEVFVKRVSTDQIKLPETKPETVLYYIKE